MPAPSAALTTLRPDLAGTLLEFDLANDRNGFVGYRVCPIINVAKPSGTFGKIPLEQLLLASTTVERAPGAGYERKKWTFSDVSYACKERGVEEPVDDREAQMYSNYFDAEQISTQRAFDRVLRAAENRIATMIFNASTWTGASLTTAVAKEWDKNHKTDADPISDVNAAKQAVWNGTGIWPNAMIISRTVFNNLRALDAITDAIESGGAGFASRMADVTTAQLAAVFDLDYILVAGSAKNTANENQTASLASMWSNEYAMICRIATTNDMAEPCIARAFHWAEDGSSPGGTVETYRDETIRGNVVRVRHDITEQVIYPECGHLLSNITT